MDTKISRYAGTTSHQDSTGPVKSERLNRKGTVARVRDGLGPRNKGISSTRRVPEKGGARGIEGRVGGGAKKKQSVWGLLFWIALLLFWRECAGEDQREQIERGPVYLKEVKVRISFTILPIFCKLLRTLGQKVNLKIF